MSSHRLLNKINICLIVLLLITNVQSGSLVVADEIVTFDGKSKSSDRLRGYDFNRDFDVNGIFLLNVTNSNLSLSRVIVDVSLPSVIVLSRPIDLFPEVEIGADPTSSLKLNADLSPGENMTLRMQRINCVEDGSFGITFRMESLNTQKVDVRIQIIIEEKGDGGCSPGITNFSWIFGPSLLLIVIVFRRKIRN